MSVIGSNQLAGASGASAGGAGSYKIERSLRFERAVSSRLAKTFSDTGSLTAWTWSGWVKRTNPDENYFVFAAETNSLTQGSITLQSTGKIRVYNRHGSYLSVITTTALFRDTSAWYHVVVVWDSSNSTQTSRVKVYVNGVPAALESTNWPGFGDPSYLNRTGIEHQIGCQNSNASYALDGYLADIHFIDGQTLTADDFGEFDSNNVWQPKRFAGSYGSYPMTVNQDQVWSTVNVNSGSTFYAAQYGYENAFDANITESPTAYTGVCFAAVGGYVQFDFTEFTNISTVRIYYIATGSTRYLQVNGTDVTIANAASGNMSFVDVSVTQLTSIKFNYVTAGVNGDWIGVSGIEVDGVLLVDSNQSPNNSFHLDFSDNSSVAALGTDSSGGNNWTPTNISAQSVTGSSITNAAVNYVAKLVNGQSSSTNTYWWYKAFDGSTTTLGFIGEVAFEDFDGFLKPQVSDAAGGIEIESGGAGAVASYNDEAQVTLNATGWTKISGTYDGTLERLRFGTTSAFPQATYVKGVRINGVEFGVVERSPGAGDSSLDTPTGYEDSSGNRGNYATLNGRFRPQVVKNGGLDVSPQSSTGWATTLGTISMQSGKWYWEYKLTSGTTHLIGVARDEEASNSFLGSQANHYGYYTNIGTKYNGAVAVNYGDTAGAGDVIGVAFDADNGEISFYKNGVVQNNGTPAYTSMPSGIYTAGFSVTGTSTGTANFGQFGFFYDPPAGYSALCTTNFPDPSIADPSTAMDVALYSGGTNVAVTGLSFKPGLAWLKSRISGGSSYANHVMADIVRGAGTYGFKNIYPNAVSQEFDPTSANDASITAINNDGFSLGGNDNTNWSTAANYVAWAWSAGENSNKTYAVTVVSSAFRFDGFASGAVTLDLEEGSTYVFDQSDSSNAGHPLRFSTTTDGTHTSGGAEYTTGVTTTGTPGSAGAKTTIVVGASTPTLYYYCSSHSGMGGQADTNETAGASNFDGGIQSTVRANSSTGFSIVGYRSTGSVNTVGHGLNSKPAVLFIKRLNGADNNWTVYHEGIDGTSPEGYHLSLNTYGVRIASTNRWNSTAPTSSVFTLSTAGTVNSSTPSDYIAYCFSPVEGYSAFGNYFGNGLTSYDGPYIYTGFRPQFVMVKAVTTSGSFPGTNGHWVILDAKRPGYNDVDRNLLISQSTSLGEFTVVDMCDFLSNGFQFLDSNSSRNHAGVLYVYMAFAENPFKTARAR